MLHPLANGRLGFGKGFQGIDYRAGWVGVELQAETGEVSGLYATFPAPPPQSTAITISRTQADTIANNVITHAGIQKATLDKTAIECRPEQAFASQNVGRAQNRQVC